MSLDRESSGDLSKGILTAFVLTLVVFSVWSRPLEAQSAYKNAVLADEPLAYWRLGEEEGGFIAENIGSAADSIDGTYTGSGMLGEDGLIFDDPDTAVRFQFDGEVQIPDSEFINVDAGPWLARTVELWFETEPDDLGLGGRFMLFEEGGDTRGLNMYVEKVEEQNFIFMTGWNRAQEFWPVILVSAAIQEETIYHAVMVFDASDDEEFGDFDGRITGYLNGVEIGTATGADRLYNHGDDTAILGNPLQLEQVAAGPIHDAAGFKAALAVVHPGVAVRSKACAQGFCQLRIHTAPRVGVDLTEINAGS